MPPSSVRLVLPIPPSANALYKRVLNGNGKRPRTAAYAAWAAEAGWAIKLALVGLPRDPIKHARIEMAFPFNYKRDLSNGVKAIEDLLKDYEVIVDDRWVDDLRVRRVPVGEELVVTIEPMEESDGGAGAADDGDTAARGWVEPETPGLFGEEPQSYVVPAR